MQIRTDSWHFRVFAWSHLAPADAERNRNYTVTLCSYFWRVTLAIFWLPLIALLCMAGKIWYVPMYLLSSGNEGFRWKFLHPFFSFTKDNSIFEGIRGVFNALFTTGLCLAIMSEWRLVLVSIFYVVAIVVAILGPYYLYVQHRKRAQDHEQKESLLFAYLFAVKNKYCPKIEFVDMDD